MIKIEEYFNGPLPPAHRDRFTIQNSGQGGQALLTVQ
jgi:hypothetical protein